MDQVASGEKLNSNIFLIDSNNSLLELRRTEYDSEALLQGLIADHPTLLGSATGADEGLLLIQREYSVPDSADGNGRWSLDHLFLDRHAVPVLVEVKRATDTRARREVIAQMLDYAANGIAYWPIDKIIDAFKSTCQKAGVDPEIRLSEFLGGSDPEAFWKSVEANLAAGRIRMIFLADEISKEVRRIVEFLNEQMRPAEVLAVEVVQYLNSNGIRTLVPKLVGATERAKSNKATSAAKEPIDESEWLRSLAEKKGDTARTGAERMIKWMRETGLEVMISSSQDSMIGTFMNAQGKRLYPFSMRRSSGNFEVSLQNLQFSPAFESEAARLEILDRMKTDLPGVKVATQKANGWPSFPLASLVEQDIWQQIQVLINDIRARAIA